MSIKKLTFKEIGKLIKTSIVEFIQGNSLFHGAALAYYTVFALVPLLYLALISVGQILGKDRLMVIATNFARENIGIKDVSWVSDFFTNIDIANVGFFMKVVGIIALIFTSTAIFNCLRTSLNEFYNLDIKRQKGQFWKDLIFRGISLLVLGAITVVIIIVYFSEAVFVNFASHFTGNGSGKIIGYIIENVGSIVTNFITFTFVFKYLHDGVVKWKLAMGGALFTSILLYLGQLLIKYYLFHFFFAADGGVAGTLLVILAWMYYSSQIIFLGAKFITVYARMVGRPIIAKYVELEEE